MTLNSHLANHLREATTLYRLFEGAKSPAWRVFYEGEHAKHVELALAQMHYFPDTPGDRRRPR
jgi:hypothetical protein